MGIITSIVKILFQKNPETAMMKWTSWFVLYCYDRAVWRAVGSAQCRSRRVIVLFVRQAVTVRSGPFVGKVLTNAGGHCYVCLSVLAYSYYWVFLLPISKSSHL